MRAQTITAIIPARLYRRRRALALAVGVCALAIPASASASPDHSSVSAITGQSSASDQPTGRSAYSSPNAITAPSTEPNSVGGSADVGTGYSSLSAITGSPPGDSEFVSELVPSTGDGFDWGDASIGAGTALALVGLAGAMLLVVRRRMAISPSASTS
jgi:hypothetical protein